MQTRVDYFLTRKYDVISQLRHSYAKDPLCVTRLNYVYKMTLIYSSEVSTNVQNYKSQKSIKIFKQKKKLSVICTTQVGCSDFRIHTFV